MSTTEKMTVNLSVVDIGKIDLLVQEGFYSNRTDFIRAAVRRQLDNHAAETEAAVTRLSIVVGVHIVTAAGLEKYRARGEKRSLNVAGMLIIEDAVTPELARDTIEAVRVWGVLRANKAIRQALGDRISRG